MRSGHALHRILTSLIVVGGTTSSSAAVAGCSLTQMEIPVKIVNWRPIATLKLNGVDAPMLVDSGAFFSMLSAATATQLGLRLRSLPFGFEVVGYTGKVESKLTTVEKVQLLGAELPNVEFIVGGNELGNGIMGVLGRNILAAADTEYDLAQGVVRLSFPKGDCKDTHFAHWAGQAPVIVVPLVAQPNKGTAIVVDVKVNGAKAHALLDTGAPQSSLTLRTARRAGIPAHEMVPVGRVGGAGEGRADAWMGPVARFELGGQKVSNNQIAIHDVDGQHRDMMLGLDYFLSHRIYVSRLQGQLYATWNGNPIFAAQRASSRELDNRYAALPQDIGPRDADAFARRGAAALAAGNVERALEDLNRACELAPDAAEHFHSRARVHAAMRSWPLALADLDSALRLDPSLVEARLRRSQVRAVSGDRSGALADLAALDAALPPSSHLRADMAQQYVRFALVPDALRQFELWLSTHPDDARQASVLNSRCWLRARLNLDLPLALKDCNAAVDKDEGASEFYDSLGWTHLRLGNPRRAKRAFDRAMALAAVMPFSLYGRGLARWQLNDAAGGDEDLAAARTLRPQIADDVRQVGFELAEGGTRLKGVGP